MEKTKRKNGDINLRRYWLFFVPFTLLMALMVKHPLRFGIGELGDDGIFYSVIALVCLAAAIRVYCLAIKQAHRLIAVILLCAVFAAWQPFDIFVLRNSTRSPANGFGLESTGQDEGFALYPQRFYSPVRDKFGCRLHIIYEGYFGNNTIAITLQIKRDNPWFACGG